MTTITCLIGRTRPDLEGADLVDLDAILGNATIREHFLKGSTLADQAAVIDLHLDSSRIDSAPFPGDQIDAYELNQTLEILRGTSGSFAGGNTMGLILAGRFRDLGNLFGVMFDLDDKIFGSGPTFAQVQRQGCAVFLGAIRAAHVGQDEAFRQHAMFTAVHELGHVFNLWHLDTTPSFMGRSRDIEFPLVAPGPPLEFAGEHRKFLARCDFDEHVQPGGSKFGDRGPGADTGDVDPFDEPAGASLFELKIDVQPREFWRFEPVELDVTLRLKGRVRRPVEIPREVDASYSRFRIWITEPSGLRRPYRPWMHCCESGDVIRIGPREPYVRDITLFRESGGYTFRSAGLHRIEATLRLSGREVRSNAVEVNVRAEPLTDRASQELGRVLTGRLAVSLLQYRAGSLGEATVGEMEEVTRRHGKTLSAAGVQYALGRALLRQASKSDLPEVATSLTEQALKRLRRARDHAYLSEHRRRVADRLVVEHGGRRRQRRKPAR